jgi:geranylgeranyl pyrophosphate synthase
LGSDADRRRLVEIIRCPREETTEGDIQWAIDFFRDQGALEYAQEEANRLVDAADTVLERLPLGEDGREKFRSVARFIVERKF